MKDARIPQFQALLDDVTGCVLAEIASAKGSTPREAGAIMLVTLEAAAGTIGGGQLEFMAIDRARQMLRRGEMEAIADVALGPEIGQCCGGRVALLLRKVNLQLSESILADLEEDFARRPQVYVFGAGHVGNALARALALLPVRLILLDTRLSELVAAPEGIETRHVAMPEDEVRAARAGSVFLVMTHDHALDFLIVREALARKDAAYVGMIGSKSKRATFSHWFKREGGLAIALERLVCPIGGQGVNDKRPEIIAALAAAEVVTALFRQRVKMGVSTPSLDTGTTSLDYSVGAA